MRILISVDNYDHGTGGAEASIRALARALAKRGHAVSVLQRDDDPGTREDEGVVIEDHVLPVPRWLRDADRDTLRWNAEWRRVLDEWLEGHPVDLVVTQQRLLYSSIGAARARDLPVVVFVRAYGMFCPSQFRDRDPLRDCHAGCLDCVGWRQRLRGSAVRRNLAAYRGGLEQASAVLANSQYMQRVLEHLLGLESSVVYPFTDLERVRAESGPHDRVLFVKPQYVKGLPIVTEVARRMPDTGFLVAGHARRRARRELGSLPNVELAGWASDMRPLYARTRVLLGPSIWPEPFGRVFVEAGSSGIPSVASARGGIPEAVGEGGILIDDVFDVDCWVEALRRLEDPATHGELSVRAREHSEAFATERGVEAFLAAVHASTGLSL